MPSPHDHLVQVPTTHVKLILQSVTCCQTVSTRCLKKIFLHGIANVTLRLAGGTTKRSHSKPLGDVITNTDVLLTTSAN